MPTRTKQEMMGIATIAQQIYMRTVTNPAHYDESQDFDSFEEAANLQARQAFQAAAIFLDMAQNYVERGELTSVRSPLAKPVRPFGVS